jgi:hypothetical protein
MSEHLGPHDRAPEPQEPEITPEQKRALIARFREKSPYVGQAVDRFGVFFTHFGLADCEVRIYIPGLSGIALESDFVDERVQLIKYMPEEPIGKETVVHITSYTISETTLESEYREETRVFDTITGKQLAPKAGDETTRLIETYALEWEFNTSPITETHLREVNTLLDSLRPDQIF